MGLVQLLDECDLLDARAPDVRYMVNAIGCMCYAGRWTMDAPNIDEPTCINNLWIDAATPEGRPVLVAPDHLRLQAMQGQLGNGEVCNCMLILNVKSLIHTSQ